VEWWTGFSLDSTPTFGTLDVTSRIPQDCGFRMVRCSWPTTFGHAVWILKPRWWQRKYLWCSPRTLEKSSKLTNICQMGWNHQLGLDYMNLYMCIISLCIFTYQIVSSHQVLQRMSNGWWLGCPLVPIHHSMVFKEQLNWKMQLIYIYISHRIHVWYVYPHFA